MLLFAHPGITLGAASVVADVMNRKPTWFTALSKYLDIRWLLVGSMLPDIIDKPVGQYIFRDTFNNGRIFSHGLFFLILITAVGFFLFKKKKQKWLLALAVGTFAHLVLDEIWLTPQTLFWPLLGLSFPWENLAGWEQSIFELIFHDPRYYVPELVGLAVLLMLLYVIIKRKKFWAFIKHGKVV